MIYFYAKKVDGLCSFRWLLLVVASSIGNDAFIFFGSSIYKNTARKSGWSVQLIGRSYTGAQIIAIACTSKEPRILFSLFYRIFPLQHSFSYYCSGSCSLSFVGFIVSVFGCVSFSVFCRLKAWARMCLSADDLAVPSHLDSFLIPSSHRLC